MRKILYILLFISIPVFSLEQFVTKDFFDTRINWSTMKITSTVTEVIPAVVFEQKDPRFGKDSTALNLTAARNKSLLKAKERLSINLFTAIENMKIDSYTSMLDRISQDEKFREKYNRIFEISEKDFSFRIIDNKIQAEAGIPFTGKNGLLNFLEINFGSEPFPEFPEIPSPSSYSGLIVDARHLNAVASLFPRITTDRGIEIYSPELVSRNYAIDTGMVSFQTDPILAKRNSRAGINPYYVVALSATGKDKTDFSIPTEDAMRIMASKNSVQNLRKCRVIILLKKQP
ncbi:MAG: hypothetical protein K8R21_16095 [Leptospira sp.]|nr:hypothetical protein [Leptospira sp.]